MKEKFYIECDSDIELSEQLHQLFIIQDLAEVQIVHPEDGEKIVTKKEYLESIELQKLSPAKRQEALKKKARKYKMKFRTMMVSAKTYIVDIEDDANFGFDIYGDKIPIEGTLFVLAKDYDKAIPLKENELGAFVDDTLKTPPIRILTNG